MNFRFNIDDVTKYGKIVSRCYREWRNRHNGPMCGDFYTFESGKTFCCELAGEKKKQKEQPPQKTFLESWEEMGLIPLLG